VGLDLLKHFQHWSVYLDEGVQRFIHVRESAQEIHGKGKEVHFDLLVRVAIEDREQGGFPRMQISGPFCPDPEALRILGAEIGRRDSSRQERLVLQGSRSEQ
jgi:hypothetical protein